MKIRVTNVMNLNLCFTLFYIFPYTCIRTHDGVTVRQGPAVSGNDTPGHVTFANCISSDLKTILSSNCHVFKIVFTNIPWCFWYICQQHSILFRANCVLLRLLPFQLTALSRFVIVVLLNVFIASLCKVCRLGIFVINLHRISSLFVIYRVGSLCSDLYSCVFITA